MTEFEYLASRLDENQLAKLRAEIAAQVAAAVQSERSRVVDLLAGPVLAAVRCIPDGEIKVDIFGDDGMEQLLYSGAGVRDALGLAHRAVWRGEQPEVEQP